MVNFSLKSDMSSLFEDFRIVRPTTILFMPRIVEITYQAYQSELQQRIAMGEDRQAADAVAQHRAARVGTGGIDGEDRDAHAHGGPVRGERIHQRLPPRIAKHEQVETHIRVQYDARPEGGA